MAERRRHGPRAASCSGASEFGFGRRKPLADSPGSAAGRACSDQGSLRTRRFRLRPTWSQPKSTRTALQGWPVGRYCLTTTHDGRHLVWMSCTGKPREAASRPSGPSSFQSCVPSSSGRTR
jgi:hypothetical protein